MENRKVKQKIRSFRDLLVWQRSMSLVTAVYRQTKTFPAEELYGLTSQLRRSAVSIPSNIAEGYGRHSTCDYMRFLRMACGSLYELQTQLEIALNLEYLDSAGSDKLSKESQEIVKMLSGMINKINKSDGSNYEN